MPQKKVKPQPKYGADFSLSGLADKTMDQMNGVSSPEPTSEGKPEEGEKNVSLQVKESIRKRLRKMSADRDVKIQGFVERSLDKALAEIGY